MRIIAAVPAFGLLAGAAFGAAYPDFPPVVLAIQFLAVATLAVLAFASKREQWFAAATLVTFASGGVVLATKAWQDVWRSPLRLVFESVARDQRGERLRPGSDRVEEEMAAVILIGRLAADATPTTGGVGLDVETQWVGRVGGRPGRTRDPANPVHGRVLLTVAGELALERRDAWRSGRTVRAVAQLRRPSRYLNPGVPDQERMLARRGIGLVGSVKSGALVDVIAEGAWFEEAASALRALARRAIATSVAPWSHRSAGIVTAIVIGDRSGLERDVQTRLQEAGTYHVIAISGGNVAILVGLTLALFRVAGLLGPLAMSVAVVALLSYGYVVGGSASVDRATLMAAVYLTGRALDLRGPPLNVLLLVAGMLAALNPLALSDPGFLLTCGATSAILVSAAATRTEQVPRLVVPVFGVMLASLAAEIALMPVGAAFFSRVTFAGLILNLVAIPAMALAQLAGMMLVPLWLAAPTLARGVGWLAHSGADALVRSSAVVDVAPFLTWRVLAPSAVVLAAYYGAGTLAWCLWRRLKCVGSREGPLFRACRIGSTAIALASAAWMLRPPGFGAQRGDGRLHVTFVDVGQGDAALIGFPRGATWLVDAGGLAAGTSFDIGDRIVAPVARRAGVGRLDALVLTHGDRDHIGGAAAMQREFRPWQVWEGVPVPRSPDLQQLQALAADHQSQWTSVQTADRAVVDGVTVLVRHPRPADWERQEVRNDDSIVLELRWRDVSFVFGGDIGQDVESAIAPDFDPAPIRVLKVPHHGSVTSSSEPFIRALAPTIAVISAGRGNTYGHPAKAVVERYLNAGSEIFRTDRDGAISMTTDGTSLNVGSHLGRTATDNSRQPRRHEGHEEQ